MLNVIRKEGITKPISLKGVVEGQTCCKDVWKDLEGSEKDGLNDNDPKL